MTPPTFNIAAIACALVLGAGAILMGYPVISDTPSTPEVRPTGVTVREAAREFGFRDPYHFSRLFKQRMGVSPKRYRGGKRR